jgi:hypothetical protein
MHLEYRGSSLLLFFILLLPLNAKLHCTTSSAMLRRLLVLEQRGVRDKVGTRIMLSFGEILEIFILGTILRSSSS